MQYEGHELNGGVLGVTENFSRIVHVDVEKGRFISNLDKHAMYCVIGAALNKKIMQFSHHTAIGQQVQVGNAIFTIVGIAKPWPENSFVYANIDNTIMVPLLTSMALSKYASINNMILRLSPDASIEQVQRQITKYMAQYAQHKRLFFRSAQELIDRMAKQSQIFTVFLGLIGSISLLVGGIGVMNIMLVSVVERRREIGIRLAVGAQRTDIRTLFLVEAVMLSLLGGTLGVIIGIMIAYVMAIFWHWEFIFFMLPPVIGFAVSVATGVFFGFYPAYKASKLDPILALRSE
jgi:putative ABC transport system permease protein